MSARTEVANYKKISSETEVLFPVEKILVSATDQRGVIFFASEDFCKVAGFTGDQLLGAPHKIVRHPDMPKGIFYLIWETLRLGRPACTYVKNRTKDGGYYWVLAVITLTSNGYLSSRIKPQTELFEKTKQIYRTLIKEEACGLSPEESASRFLEILEEEGFANFDEFGGHALSMELKHRPDTHPEIAQSFAAMDELERLIEDMKGLVDQIHAGFERVRGEPVNLRILSGRLEGAGAALSTISQNYDAMAKEMHDLVRRLHEPDKGALQFMHSSILYGRQAQQNAHLFTEATDLVLSQGFAREEEMQIMQESRIRLQGIGRQKLSEIASIGKSIPDICRSLRRRINGLDVVKLLCKVESGRMRDVDSGLDGIIARLEDFHNNTDRHLADLSGKASQITQMANAITPKR